MFYQKHFTGTEGLLWVYDRKSQPLKITAAVKLSGDRHSIHWCELLFCTTLTLRPQADGCIDQRNAE